MNRKLDNVNTTMRVTLIFFTCIIFIGYCASLRAQDSDSIPSDRESVRAWPSQNYLRDIEIRGQTVRNGSVGNRSPLEVAFLRVGRWDLRPGDIHTVILAEGLSEECAAVRNRGRSVRAVRWLESQLDSIRVLMFNENHGDPGPRWFLGELLPLLHEHGFRHLGLEALNTDRPLDPPDAELTAEPRAAIDDPVFAGLIRKALRLGFSVFGYDRFDTTGWQDKDRYDRIITREAGQAAALAERIAAIPDDEKLVVLGGFTHITEDWNYLRDGRRLGWMAAQFHERTGIDPLSIDLVTCPVEVEARAKLDRARIYLSGWRGPIMVGPYAGRVDAQFHIPAGGTAPGAFRHAFGQPWHLPADAVPRERMILLEAFAKGAPANALPQDRLMLRPGENFPLFLPPGRYVVQVFDSSGASLAEIDADISS